MLLVFTAVLFRFWGDGVGFERPDQEGAYRAVPTLIMCRSYSVVCIFCNADFRTGVVACLYVGKLRNTAHSKSWFMAIPDSDSSNFGRTTTIAGVWHSNRGLREGGWREGRVGAGGQGRRGYVGL